MYIVQAPTQNNLIETKFSSSHLHQTFTMSILSSFFFLLTVILLHSFPIPTISTSSNILYDVYPFVRVYTNGTIQRFFGQDRVPPSPTDPTTLVHSKDIQIQPGLSVRIFLAHNPTHKKLPLVIYFHGGGFFSESAFSPTYHHHLNSIASKAKVIVVSVNYRLAPEFLLPAAYEDSWAALKWTFSRNTDIWVRNYADFARVYLGGDSVGANIAHQMSIRVGSNFKSKIVGMFLSCPYFWGKRAIGKEAEYTYSETLGKVWTYAYPKCPGGLDNPMVNPGMDPGLRNVGCKRVLVHVAGLDVLRYRGLYYGEVLKKSGWCGVVKVVEVPREEHVFFLLNSTSPNSRAYIQKLAYFLNDQ